VDVLLTVVVEIDKCQCPRKGRQTPKQAQAAER